MVIRYPIAIETAYQDLIDKAWNADFRNIAATGGSPVLQESGGGKYWYWQANTGFDIARPAPIYLGRDNEITRARVEAMRGESEALRERRDLVRSLRGARIPAPDRLTGKILMALSEAGVFRLRGVVVGSVAFQSYGPLLGVRLSASLSRTDDLDLAQFHSIAVLTEDSINVPLYELLQRVDPDFTAIPDPIDGRRTLRYALRRGGQEVYSVDVLCPLRGPERDRVTYLRALKSHAQIIRFLDFLLYQERPAVALFGSGVPINVPAPERYALHKLLVGQMRHTITRSQIKARKDFDQARALVDALIEVAPDDLGDAWQDLIGRGPSWRQKAAAGLRHLTDDGKKFLLEVADPNRITP